MVNSVFMHFPLHRWGWFWINIQKDGDFRVNSAFLLQDIWMLRKFLRTLQARNKNVQIDSIMAEQLEVKELEQVRR